MRMTGLTREQIALLNTNFGSALEKHAAAIVDQENENFEEVEKVAADCMEYGAELAMHKIAELEALHAEKVAAEEDEEDYEEESEEEKTAHAMGRFITEGFWNTLMEKGAEYYGDPNIYIEELVKLSAPASKAGSFADDLARAFRRGKRNIGKAYSSARESAQKTYRKAKKHIKAHPAAYAAGAGGAAGLGAGYMMGRRSNRD